ncbi:hypothetical protein SAMN04487920_1572 [Bacillus mycoides]|nr:hypothetical protein BG05_2572 [Bacillus mycoides]EJS05676.1 hypothetical protein IKM_02105 [Bacillus mycoides]SFQ92808.1 hypothetical protein SAMN04487920_1572 [Bacillus mycoides]
MPVTSIQIPSKNILFTTATLNALLVITPTQKRHELIFVHVFLY